jgi:hypothetical protein
MRRWALANALACGVTGLLLLLEAAAAAAAVTARSVSPVVLGAGPAKHQR